jgi:hypothetical protein
LLKLARKLLLKKALDTLDFSVSATTTCKRCTQPKILDFGQYLLKIHMHQVQ